MNKKLTEQTIGERLKQLENGLEKQIADLLRLFEEETGMSLQSTFINPDKKISLTYKSEKD